VEDKSENYYYTYKYIQTTAFHDSGRAGFNNIMSEAIAEGAIVMISECP
jgi:hypothetical protein